MSVHLSGYRMKAVDLDLDLDVRFYYRWGMGFWNSGREGGRIFDGVV